MIILKNRVVVDFPFRQRHEGQHGPQENELLKKELLLIKKKLGIE